MKKILQTPSENIARLLQHGRFLDYITQRIITYLPKDFSDKITVVRFDKKTLVLAARSSVIACKLRFFIPQLNRSLKAESRFSQLTAIKVKVTTEATAKRTSRNNPVCSNFAAKTLHDNAQFINDDELKASLLNLSRHISEKEEADS